MKILVAAICAGIVAAPVVVLAQTTTTTTTGATSQPLLQPIDPVTGQPLQPTAQGATSGGDLAARLAGIEGRLSRLERIFENQVVRELLQSVDALQQEVRELRGEIENQYNDLEIVQKRQNDLYRDSDRRLRELELGVSSTPTAGVTRGLPEAPQPAEPSSSTQQQVATAAPAAQTQYNEADEKAAYVAAFEFLKTGQYAEAIKAYGGFLEKYPSGRYADNAQYWRGEASYVSRNFQAAVTEFQKVVANYPSSPKVADARLKIGFALYEMQRYDDARTSLELAVRDYPNSSVARLARQRLARMKTEGR